MTEKEPAAPENFVCPHCQKEIEAAAIIATAASLMGKKGGKKGGKATSEAKAAAARINAKKPRPRKPKPDTETRP